MVVGAKLLPPWRPEDMTVDMVAKEEFWFIDYQEAQCPIDSDRECNPSCPIRGIEEDGKI